MGKDEFADAENWQSQKNSIKDIALKQYERCMAEGSKNFSGPNGQMQREIYINSIKQMETLLYPKILNKAFAHHKKNIVENESKVSTLKKEFSETYQRLKNKNQPINEPLLKDNYEHALVEIYREKLVILSMILEGLNYFDEIGVEDS